MTKVTDSALDEFLVTKSPAPLKTESKAKPKGTRFGRFRIPPSINLSPQMLPPLTRNKMAIYEVVNVARDGRQLTREVNGKTIQVNNIGEIPPVQLSPVYKIYDRFEEDLARRMKTMVFSDEINVQEYFNTVAKNIDPTTTMKLEMPELLNGQVIVDCEANYTKYVWWELHPLNDSNKFRDKTKTPLFKRADVHYSSPHLQLMKMDLQRDAEEYVIKLNAEKLINLASAFGIPSSVSIQDMRLDLRIKAKNNPEEVLFKSPEKHAATLRLAVSCMDLSIIDYNSATQEFFFPHADEPFFTVPLDQTPLEALAKWLTTEEGEEAKTYLETTVSFWK